MTKEQETIARALEIAITLTDEKHLTMSMDANKNVFMQEPLLSNLEKVIQIMSAKNLINICNSTGTADHWVYPMKK
jgi:hypothetical protein